MTFRSCRTLNSRSLWRKWFSGRSLSRVGVSTSRNVASWSTLTQHTWSSGAALPIETDGVKLLGAPIGTEPFRTDFVELRASKACASVPALEHLPPSATWTILRYCVNERLNYLAQVTKFPLVQDSLARMDEIIDHALLRAGAPARDPRPPDSPHHAHFPLSPH